MLNYKKHVMDDLDALLADLHSTTQHISSYQSQQPRDSYHSSDRDSQSSTPPPLPPPPPQEVLDSLQSPYPYDEPLYEAQNINHNSIPHRVPVSEFRDPAQQHQAGRTAAPKVPPPVAPKPDMTSIGNNLSELDQLLKDLNSAQFIAEVDKRTTPNQPMTNGSDQRSPGIIAPKAGGRTSVDSLLDQLELSGPTTPGSGGYGGPTSPRSGSGHDYSYSSTTTHSLQQNYHPPSPREVPVQGASSATRELDDLMASLSEFKLSHGPGNLPPPPLSHGPGHSPGNPPPPQQPYDSPGDPAYAKPQKSKSLSNTPTSPTPTGNQLDTLLGDLSSDLSKQGITTKNKGHCAACNKPIVGQVITALGRMYHIDHFVCTHCNQQLGTQNFYERDGQAYCEKDYHNLFAPRCAYCNGPIVDKCITALDKAWHTEHFFCFQCGKPFGDEGFHERDGKAFCRQDYFEMFAPKCGGCMRPIMDKYISALNQHWHTECFVCWECHNPFGAGSFFDHDGYPYCETHYYAKRGSLCASCQKPITGRCITAMYRKFHPEHFQCAFCLKQLNKGTFKEQNDKPYCHPCFVKLFG